jgi:hypothetical protein
MSTLRTGLAIIFLAMLLNGCASAIGDADVGPNAGGGFYDGPNLNVGQINPVHGLSYHGYANLGQPTW